MSDVNGRVIHRHRRRIDDGKGAQRRSRNNCRGSDAARELGCPRLARGSFTFVATPVDLPRPSPPPRSPAAAPPPLANGEVGARRSRV